jgi:hypothetical protein
MSENNDENKDENRDENKDNSGIGISDDQLPEDLVPSEDNPLAEGLPDGETVDDLRGDGKRADSADDNQPADDDSSADSADQSNGSDS